MKFHTTSHVELKATDSLKCPHITVSPLNRSVYKLFVIQQWHLLAASHTVRKVQQQNLWTNKSKADLVHDNKALFEDVRKEWQVTIWISVVSNYTGLQITALAAYILKSISTNEDKQVISRMFSFAISLGDDVKSIGLHQSTIITCKGTSFVYPSNWSWFT